jgi:hypothetical protein
MESGRVTGVFVKRAFLAVIAFRVLVPVVVLAASIGSAEAQETRAEVLRNARLAKEQQLDPYQPNMLETVLKAIEKSGVPLITRDGIYLKFGSLTTGSGFAYGAGYRSRRLWDGLGSLDLWGGASATRYWAGEARLRFPRLAAGRVDAQGYVRRYDYPQEDYFGLGPDSKRGDQSDYALRATAVGGRAAVRPFSHVALGAGLEYFVPRIGDGTDDSVPSLSHTFDHAMAPGLSQRQDYVRSSAFVDIDWRQPLNARKGGWYRAEFSHYDDRRGGYTFNRVDVDLRHFVSFLSERRVLFGRAFVSTSDVGPGAQMPFYLMPMLGGNDTLRGFREYRFRAPHALLLQGEYRFEVWSGLDAALFYDAGKVAMDRGGLDFHNLERDYGFGFRFNTDNGIVFRVDSAFGSRDGKHLWIVFGGTF